MRGTHCALVPGGIYTCLIKMSEILDSCLLNQSMIDGSVYVVPIS